MARINISVQAACSGGLGQLTVSFSAVNVDNYTISIDGPGGTQYSPIFNMASGGTYTFNGLPNGVWWIEVQGQTTAGSASTTAATNCVPVAPVNDLTLSASGTNPTAHAAIDGRVSLSVSTSNGPFKTKLNSGAFTTGKTLYTGLAAGTYTVTAEDAAGFTKQATVTLVSPPAPVFGCTDPNATNYNPAATEDNGTCVYPRPPAFFLMPMLNSLRFVRVVVPNNCSTFPTLDNQLFCKSEKGNYNPGYYQKVANCDVLVFQFRSNYTSHVIKLHNEAGEQIGANLVHELKVAKVSAREFRLNCAGLASGRYYLSLAATDPEYAPVNLVSEPFLVKPEHEGTHLITYRHSKNKYDMVYATGITGQLRVESRFFKRRASGESSVMRDCNNNLLLLSSSARRRVLLETFYLPGYLHEKLAVVFRHDQLQVNGVDFATDENYEFDYTAGFALANGSVLLEQVGWFAAGNAGAYEPGSSNSGYLLANNGYLEVSI